MDVRDIKIFKAAAQVNLDPKWHCTAKTLGGQSVYLQHDGSWKPTDHSFLSEREIKNLLDRTKSESVVHHREPEPEPFKSSFSTSSDSSDDSISSFGFGGLGLGGGDSGGFTGGGGDFGGGGGGGDW